MKNLITGYYSLTNYSNSYIVYFKCEQCFTRKLGGALNRSESDKRPKTAISLIAPDDRKLARSKSARSTPRSSTSTPSNPMDTPSTMSINNILPSENGADGPVDPQHEDTGQSPDLIMNDNREDLAR